MTGIGQGAAIVLATLFTLAYIVARGFRSVVETKGLQFALMYGGFALLLPIAAGSAGGWSCSPSSLPPEALAWDGGRGPGWVAAWYFIALQTLVEPTFYQRCFAARTPRVAQFGILVVDRLLRRLRRADDLHRDVRAGAAPGAAERRRRLPGAGRGLAARRAARPVLRRDAGDGDVDGRLVPAGRRRDDRARPGVAPLRRPRRPAALVADRRRARRGGWRRGSRSPRSRSSRSGTASAASGPRCCCSRCSARSTRAGARTRGWWRRRCSRRAASRWAGCWPTGRTGRALGVEPILPGLVVAALFAGMGWGARRRSERGA